MNVPDDIASLSALFEKLGAKDSKSWASSQIKEGIPQLQRFLFLRQAWSTILDEDNIKWIEGEIQNTEKNPSGPYAGVGSALKHAIAKGVSPQDLTDIARGIQAQMLFQICYLLDDPSFSEPELQDFSWGLFEVDEEDNPIQPRIGGLHESVLETDPTGREMRPRGEKNA
jgi:hypothetical protein